MADPVLDTAAIAAILHTRTVPLPASGARAALAAAWRMHLVPAAPGLLDAVLRLPLLDAGRARDELDWVPSTTATQAVAEFFEGLHRGLGADTPPLASSGAGAGGTRLAGGAS
ncbi:hypothetical protein [Streptomyces sp. NPDC085540]|uniref:hypothetical protein n=1 Tax=Streptomyces sp. NPDC085540 TaxID=3365730 RepID=UPI0037D41B7E